MPTYKSHMKLLPSLIYPELPYTDDDDNGNNTDSTDATAQLHILSWVTLTNQSKTKFKYCFIFKTIFLSDFCNKNRSQ